MMDTPHYETRLDNLFDCAFAANHPACEDWAQVKFELQRLRKLKEDFMEAGTALLNSQDSTGCSEDLTVVDYKTVEAINSILAGLKEGHVARFKIQTE